MRTKNKYSGFSRKKEKQRFLTFRIVVVHCFYQEIIMEQNQGVDDRIAEQTTDESIEETSETPKGILYETSLRQAEKNAKKEKRKGVMQFIKYALCAASAGIIQIVLFSILQAVIPSNGKTIHFIVEDMDLVTFIATTVALCASILGTLRSTASLLLRMPVTFPKQWFWHFCSTFRSTRSKRGTFTQSRAFWWAQSALTAQA